MWPAAGWWLRARAWPRRVQQLPAAAAAAAAGEEEAHRSERDLRSDSSYRGHYHRVLGGRGSKNSTTASTPSQSSSPNGSSGSQSGPLEHIADVEITSCTTDPTLQAPTAKLKVTNSSSKSSDYSITVALESKDGATQYDTGNAFVQNLGPGQSSNEDAPSLKQDIPAGFTCKVVSADRISAVG